MADHTTRATKPMAPIERRHLQLARMESLRKRLVSRDERALVELIDVATPWLLGVAEGILRDSAESEDVVLEAFRRIWDQIHTITETQAGLMPWLLRVTRNLAIDRARARKRRLESEASLTAHYAVASETAQVGPDGGWLGGHVHTTVRRAIGELSAEQAHAVHLAFFSGLTHSEIAAALGVPLGTVKGRLRLAFEKLRISLASVKDWAL